MIKLVINSRIHRNLQPQQAVDYILTNQAISSLCVDTWGSIVLGFKGVPMTQDAKMDWLEATLGVSFNRGCCGV